MMRPTPSAILPALFGSGTVVVFALTAFGEAPSRGAMITNRIAFSVALLATFAFALRGLREGSDGTRVAAATAHFFYGVATSILSALHLGAVLTLPFRSEFIYDYRFVSLVLLGVVLIVPAVRALRASGGIRSGDPQAWRIARNAVLVLLLVDAPLVPLQGFAIPFTAGAVLDLAVLWRVRPNPSPTEDPR